MKILAIETSCDDTCVAILEVKDRKTPRFKILSNIVSSQIKLHAKYGGVYPFLAKREHQKNLPIIFEKALKEAKKPKLNLIAVTNGPGLEPCLWVGVNFAKDLAESLKLPLMPVNHIEAHIFANWLQPIGKAKDLFPAICLVVSGGHTQLILMRGFGKYKILGETRDDAAGECFDKTARILGLGYPGGSAIAAEAAKFKVQSSKFKVSLPRPMIYQKNYDFSFSGLKTAVLYLVKQLVDELRSSSRRRDGRRNLFLRPSPPFANAWVTESGKKLTIRQKREISAEIQQAVIDVLIHKTLKAAKECKAKTIILGGGVSANQELRKQFKERIKNEIPYSKFYIPNSKFCTDNAAMVAVAGYFHTRAKRRVENNEYSSTRQEKRKPEDIEANANQRI